MEQIVFMRDRASSAFRSCCVSQQLSAFVVAAFALAASACAVNTGSDSGSAGAGTNNSAAGNSAGGGASGGAPANGAGGALSTAGTGTGTGGVANTAGAPNTGGTSSGTCSPIAAADLISDFETGTAVEVMAGGRGGDWFVFNDGTGMQTPVKVPNTPLPAEAGGACGSMFGFHSTATGFTVFGAGFGVDFAPKPPMTTASIAYDASMYSGVALRVKAANPVTLRVSVSDSGTAVEGMKCTNTTVKTDKTRCGDYFGSDITVGTDWQDFVLPFAMMAQRGFGLPITTGLDKAHVYTLRAQVKGSAAAPCVFDLWIDDVRFVL